MWDKNSLDHLLQFGVVSMRDYFEAFISCILTITNYGDFYLFTKKAFVNCMWREFYGHMWILNNLFQMYQAIVISNFI